MKINFSLFPYFYFKNTQISVMKKGNLLTKENFVSRLTFIKNFTLAKKVKVSITRFTTENIIIYLTFKPIQR